MIIEFIGAPGAGKTILLPVVLESLQKQGFTALTYLDAGRPFANRTLPGQVVSRLAPRSLRGPLLWRVFLYLSTLYMLKFFANHPKLIWLVLRSQRGRPEAADIRRRNVLKWFFRLVGYREFLKSYLRPNEALVFDEGFVHRVVQLNASGVEEPNPAGITAYLDRLPQPDLVIFVQAPPGVCEDRVHSRGLWERWRHKDPAEISQFIVNAGLIVNLAVAHIKQKGWTVIEVDNGANDLLVSQATLHGSLVSQLPPAAYQRHKISVELKVETPLIGTNRIYRLPRPTRVVRSIKARLISPRIKAETIGQVLSYYGLKSGQPPQNLPFGQRNRNVIVFTPAGKKVLKLYRKKWQIPTILYEHSILTRLEQVNLSGPRLVTTIDNETLVSLGDQHYALFDFVGGANVAASYLLPAQRRKLLTMSGKTLAELHRHLLGFLPQGRHHLGFKSYTADRWRDLAWHLNILDRLPEQTNRWIKSEDRIHLDWLVKNRQYIRDKLCQLEESLNEAPLPRLVIHGDYGLHNLQFHRNGAVTVYDFELARLEWRLTDLVIVLSRIPIERSQHFMAGYQATYPLSADEWHYLSQVWQLYRLQGAVQYWHTFVEIGGSARLVSARERIKQAEWAATHKPQLLKLRYTFEE